jgi:hypothetical protein
LVIEVLLFASFFFCSFSLAIDWHSWRCHFPTACLSYRLGFAGKKIDQCKVDRDEVLILKGPISDAKRIALTVCPPKTSVFDSVNLLRHVCNTKYVQKDAYLLAIHFMPRYLAL